jgi:death-on-curing protein
LRDRPALEGVVAAPFHGWGNAEFYPTLIQKAAKYLEGICIKQAFVDGNKRTAWLTTHSFIRLNGLGLILIDDDEIAETVEMMITRQMSLDEVTMWLNDRVYLDDRLQS